MHRIGCFLVSQSQALSSSTRLFVNTCSARMYQLLSDIHRVQSTNTCKTDLVYLNAKGNGFLIHSN